MKKMLLSGIAALVLVCGLNQASYAQDKGEDTITVAMIGEPPTLDVQTSSVIVTTVITQHIFETLFAFDGASKAQPLLAASMPSISADGLVYTIPLRTDVTFHDGQPMTAEDVVASLNRWMKVSSRGKQPAEYISAISATGAHEVTITLKRRYAPLLVSLSQVAVIMPKSVLADKLATFIGTGPYMLKEHKPDQYIDLVRFDGYKSPAGPADGYAGHREAMARQILFMPVPDANTRVEGVLSGQYDFADSLPISASERLKESAVAQPVILPAAGWMSLNMNMKAGLLTDVRLRKAVGYALNANDLMAAAFDQPDFFDVNGGLFPKGNTWYTDAGVERHGEGDIAEAQKLMQEAGYKDTPIRILTTRQYEFHFKLAQIAKAYLEAAGFKVDLQVSDWASLTARRSDAAQWDIFITNSVQPVDPAAHNTFSAAYPGWYDTDGKKAALAAYMDSSEGDARMEAWKKLQTQFYQDAPIYKAGDFNTLAGASKKLEGLQSAVFPFFWNVKAGQ